jgi:hypothetical protein
VQLPHVLRGELRVVLPRIWNSSFQRFARVLGAHAGHLEGAHLGEGGDQLHGHLGVVRCPEANSCFRRARAIQHRAMGGSRLV